MTEIGLQLNAFQPICDGLNLCSETSSIDKLFLEPGEETLGDRSSGPGESHVASGHVLLRDSRMGDLGEMQRRPDPSRTEVGSTSLLASTGTDSSHGLRRDGLDDEKT
jgi:hypothetical protein